MKSLVCFVLCFLALFAAAPPAAAQGGVEPCLSDLLTDVPTRRPGVRGAVYQGSKKWVAGQKIRVLFLDGPEVWKSKIVQYSQIWEQYANLDFVYVASGPAEIRISFAFQPGAAWSLIGRDSERYSMVKVGDEYRSQAGNTTGPSMNYGTFNERTPEDEFRRKALHEFGHALGLLHEHQNGNGSIQYDYDKVFEYYQRTAGWSRERTESQVLKRYGPGSQITNGEYDRLSIMHYPVDPALTKNGIGVPWNSQLSAGDQNAIAELYPFPGGVRPKPPTTGGKVEPRTPAPLAPEVAIRDIAVNFEGYDERNDREGMEFLIDFDVRNAANLPLTLAIYFYDADGTPLADSNRQFYSANGKVAVFSRFTPKFANTSFNQYKVLMPYDELELECGEHELKFSIGIWNGQQRIISTGYEYFTYEQPCDEDDDSE
jgi:hypothetical protein